MKTFPNEGRCLFEDCDLSEDETHYYIEIIKDSRGHFHGARNWVTTRANHTSWLSEDAACGYFCFLEDNISDEAADTFLVAWKSEGILLDS